MTASLSETAGQAETVATATEELVSGVNEMAASIEQVSANTVSLARRSPRASTSIAGDGGVDSEPSPRRPREMATAAEEVTTSINEMAASIRSVNRDAESLASSVEQTAASLTEMSASVRSVSGNADDLAAAAEETASSINEMAASIEEVGAMTENLATHGRAERDGDRSDVALGAERGHRAAGRLPTPAVGARRPAAAQMERSIESVAALARRADEVDTARVDRGRGGRRGGAAVDPGHRPAARDDGAIVDRDEARWASGPTRSARSSTPST